MLEDRVDVEQSVATIAVQPRAWKGSDHARQWVAGPRPHRAQADQVMSEPQLAHHLAQVAFPVAGVVFSGKLAERLQHRRRSSAPARKTP
ncbi:hypothetical protein ALQ25_200040 [Pseudomonas coronafaciens pv. atropurpurea]|nr:hypothetical protein ALQ25_200040 [Pseudomonas coronafaciens pv. atropurpurea]